MGRPGGRWKAESQGFPTATIRASEDIICSSYAGFEIVSPSAGFFKIQLIVPPPAGNGAAICGNLQNDDAASAPYAGRLIGRPTSFGPGRFLPESCFFSQYAPRGRPISTSKR